MGMRVSIYPSVHPSILIQSSLCIQDHHHDMGVGGFLAWAIYVRISAFLHVFCIAALLNVHTSTMSKFSMSICMHAVAYLMQCNVT